jgi:hypothetical protein
VDVVVGRLGQMEETAEEVRDALREKFSDARLVKPNFPFGQKYRWNLLS